MTAYSYLVSELIDTFRDSLRAVVPCFERLSLSWREPDDYDEWESVSQSLFVSLVLGTLVDALGDREHFPFIGYDWRTDDYAEMSFIGVDIQGAGYAFVCFETSNAPFDTCLLVAVSDDGSTSGHLRVRYEDCSWYAAIQGHFGRENLSRASGR